MNHELEQDEQDDDDELQLELLDVDEQDEQDDEELDELEQELDVTDADPSTYVVTLVAASIALPILLTIVFILDAVTVVRGNVLGNAMTCVPLPYFTIPSS